MQSAGAGSAVGPPLNASQPGVDVAVLFYITEGNEGNLFSLGLCNGQLRLVSATLDYHVTPVYTLVVEARSNGLLASATSANITVTVLNVPHTPLWLTAPCTRVINESSASPCPRVYVLSPCAEARMCVCSYDHRPCGDCGGWAPQCLRH